jgi:hypothetical protein
LVLHSCRGAAITPLNPELCRYLARCYQICSNTMADEMRGHHSKGEAYTADVELVKLTELMVE